MSSVLPMPGTGTGPVSCDLVIAGEVFFSFSFFAAMAYLLLIGQF
jgi:hypothetical protein